jgi:hypothetical protein
LTDTLLNPHRAVGKDTEASTGYAWSVDCYRCSSTQQKASLAAYGPAHVQRELRGRNFDTQNSADHRISSGLDRALQKDRAAPQVGDTQIACPFGVGTPSGQDVPGLTASTGVT